MYNARQFKRAVMDQGGAAIRRENMNTEVRSRLNAPVAEPAQTQRAPVRQAAAPVLRSAPQRLRKQRRVGSMATMQATRSTL